MAHNCLNGLYSSVASLAPRVDLFDPCDFLEKCLLSFSQIFSASLHSEISEIGDWETRPSCHFRVHMSTTVITNYHALVPSKKMSRRLFNTMEACSQTASALEPLMPLERKSINSRWLSLSQTGLERNISKNNNRKRTIHV